MKPWRVAIVGSGFTGSILARVLRVQGHQVTLIERGRHPRFSLGESSTPLAALSLERLAAHYGLEDLYALAAHGRWRKRLPHLRRGRKRGFSFFAHEPGMPFHSDATDSHRLLVAASPDDDIADCHWLREDVDHFLVQCAVSEGIEYLDGLEVTDAVEGSTSVALSGHRFNASWSDTFDVVVDASGGAPFTDQLAPAASTPALQTTLVACHFQDAPSFVTLAAEEGTRFPPGPYPDETAAIHHILHEGWMYVLPFDHGVASAGLLLHGDRIDREWQRHHEDPPALWRKLLGRYPTLSTQFAGATPCAPWTTLSQVARRRSTAAGARWILMPHTYGFLSPLYSSGIAWSLRAVERVARILEDSATKPHPDVTLAAGFGHAGALLEREFDLWERLLVGAYQCMDDFDRFVAWSHLYFAFASFQEATERLQDPPPEGFAMQGFLGATDPVVTDALQRVVKLQRDSSTEEFAASVRQILQPRNVMGLQDPRTGRRIAVDPAPLIEGASHLGMTPADVRQRLGQLRGA